MLYYIFGGCGGLCPPIICGRGGLAWRVAHVGRVGGMEGCGGWRVCVTSVYTQRTFFFTLLFLFSN